MGSRSWEVVLDETKHSVRLEHSYFGGKRTLFVDGVRHELKRIAVDFGSSHPFVLGGHEAVARIRTNGLWYSYDLEVDGISMNTGKPSDDAAVSMPVPKWAWVFVGLCGLLPVLSLGGAVPTAIGGMGIVGCLQHSRRTHVSVWLRVLVCSLITFACWFSMFVFLLGVAYLQGELSGGP